MFRQISFRIALLLFCCTANSVFGQAPLNTQPSPEKALADKLIAEKSETARAKLLASNEGLINVKLAEELQEEGNRLYGTVGWPVLLDIYRLQLDVAEKIGDKAQIVKALNGVGNARLSMGEKKDALEIYNRALALAEGGKDKLMVSKLLSNLCQAKDCELEEFRSNLLRALAIDREVGDKLSAAIALTRLGNGHTRRGYLIEALEYHKQSLALARELGDKQQISISLSSIGIVYQDQGRYEEAARAFRESIALSREIGDKEGETIDLYNLGNQFVEMGDLSSALAVFNESIELGKRHGMEQSAIGAEYNLADLYHKLGRNELAEAKFADLLARFEKSGDNYGRDLALRALGDLLSEDGQFARAIEYYQQALTIALSVKNEAGEAKTLATLGTLYSKSNNAAKALESFQRASDINSRLGSPNEAFETKLALAAFHLEFGEKVLAAKLIGELAGQAENARYDHRWQFHSLAGRVRGRNGDAAAAKQSFERSIALINSRTRGLPGELSREYLSSKLEPFYRYSEFLIENKEFGKAYEIAEASHSRSLVDIVRNGRVEEKFLLPTDLESVKLLKANIVSLNRLLDTEASKPNPEAKAVAGVKKRIEVARNDLETLQIRVSADKGLRTAKADFSPISVKESVSLLNNERSVALEYTVTPKSTFVFVLTKDPNGLPRLEAVEIRVTERELIKKLESFRTKVAGGELGFVSESTDLFNALLRPVSSHLTGRTNIVIVPDGPLWDLPFQALMDEKGKFLAEKMAISYAPSLTALNEMKKKAAARKMKRPAGAELIAFGNPILSSETATRVKRVFMNEKLEPLPEAERLVNSLSKMYGPARSKVFTGAAAREEVAKKESPNYRIVQFATHGILNNASPMYSHLVFAKDDKNPNEDGLLEAWELKDLDLNADMVILSACDTARGRISAGEGIIGMTWASFIAGAPTTVASQWKVESSSTTELMLEFHRQLLGGKVSKAEALRRAQLKLLRNPKYRHPSYWAAWVVVGDAS